MKLLATQAKFPNETILQELPVCLPNPSVWQLSAGITMNSFGRMIVRDAVTVERLTPAPSGDNSDRTRFHWPGESRVERLELDLRSVLQHRFQPMKPCAWRFRTEAQHVVICTAFELGGTGFLPPGGWSSNWEISRRRKGRRRADDQ